MADNAQFSAFSERELRKLAKTFTLMGEQTVEKSKAVAYEIAQLAKSEIQSAGYQRTKSGKVVKRIVDAVVVDVVLILLMLCVVDDVVCRGCRCCCFDVVVDESWCRAGGVGMAI